MQWMRRPWSVCVLAIAAPRASQATTGTKKAISVSFAFKTSPQVMTLLGPAGGKRDRCADHPTEHVARGSGWLLPGQSMSQELHEHQGLVDVAHAHAFRDGVA